MEYDSTTAVRKSGSGNSNRQRELEDDEDENNYFKRQQQQQSFAMARTPTITNARSSNNTNNGIQKMGERGKGGKGGGREDEDEDVANMLLLRKPRRVKGQVRSDGCILPSACPRREADGGFRRPAGRKPVGMEWDITQGLWAPRSLSTRTVGRAQRPSSSNGEEEEGDENNDSGYDEETDSEVDENEELEDDSQQQQQQAPPEPPDEEECKRQKQRQSNKRRRAHRMGSNFNCNSLNKRSMWLEPEREDGLTLYERHRMPRPIVTGRIQRPLKLLLQEFRCAICLGCIHKARMVVECLHRFCDDCIERAMRVGRNQCPICRVIIPSRRSLAADPDFDQLVLYILGEGVDHVEDAHDVATNYSEHRDKAVQLQQAIFRKKTEGDGGGAATTIASPAAASNTEKSETSTSRSEENTASYSRGGACDLGVNILDIALFRHEDEMRLDELELPYLRLAETATVETLKVFLQRKLGQLETKLQIVSYVDEEQKKAVILTDWMTLAAVAKTFADTSRNNIVPLYYRVEPPRAKPGRKIIL